MELGHEVELDSIRPESVLVFVLTTEVFFSFVCAGFPRVTLGIDPLRAGDLRQATITWLSSGTGNR